MPGTISRREAGIWFILFLRFIWFNEHNKQDKPSHQVHSPGLTSPSSGSSFHPHPRPGLHDS